MAQKHKVLPLQLHVGVPANSNTQPEVIEAPTETPKQTYCTPASACRLNDQATCPITRLHRYLAAGAADRHVRLLAPVRHRHAAGLVVLHGMARVKRPF